MANGGVATPVLAVMILPQGAPAGGPDGDGASDPYGSAFYNAYRSVLRACIRMRWLTVAARFSQQLLTANVWRWWDQVRVAWRVRTGFRSLVTR